MKKDVNNLGLDSKAISALPIINRFIQRIELKELLSQYIPSKDNQKLSHADEILLFDAGRASILTNIVLKVIDEFDI